MRSRAVIGNNRPQGKPLRCGESPSGVPSKYLTGLAKMSVAAAKGALTSPKGRQGCGQKAALATKKGEPGKARPSRQSGDLDFQNGHDLEGRRIDHEDLLADQDEVIAAPFRIDRHDLRWKRVEADVARHAGA